MFRVLNNCLGLILILVLLPLFLGSEMFELIKEIIMQILEIVNKFLSQFNQ